MWPVIAMIIMAAASAYAAKKQSDAQAEAAKSKTDVGGHTADWRPQQNMFGGGAGGGTSAGVASALSGNPYLAIPAVNQGGGGGGAYAQAGSEIVNSILQSYLSKQPNAAMNPALQEGMPSSTYGYNAGSTSLMNYGANLSQNPYAAQAMVPSATSSANAGTCKG